MITQLENPAFRFVLIKKGEKGPFENGWQKESNYAFDALRLRKHTGGGGNYGVLCGPGGLVVIDCDRLEMLDLVFTKLPESLTVQNQPEKGHVYFICRDVPENINYLVLKKDGMDGGELRARNAQVVGPGSIHPSGRTYEVTRSKPIAEIGWGKIKEALKEWMQEASAPAAVVEWGKEEGVDNFAQVLADMKKSAKWDKLLSGDESGYASTSEADMAVVGHLKLKGLNFEQVDHVMTEICKLGKWATAPLDYKRRTYGKIRPPGAERVEAEYKKEQKRTPKSCVFRDGRLYEQIYTPARGSLFLSYQDGEAILNEFVGDYEPISTDAIEKGVILLPDTAEEYGSLPELVAEIQAHVHKYLDVSPDMEVFVVYYVLLSWLQDKTRTVNYLSFMGDWGSGKSRGLDIVGRLCYKPVLVNGSLTVAPIYRLLDLWGGTLVIDEGDFKKSDETADLMKVLNAGFEASRASVVRCNPNDASKIDSFNVYGCKVISRRKPWSDKALESRCLTETMQQTRRKDIIPVLGDAYFNQEANLRRKLLKFRFDYYGKISYEYQDLGVELEPRLKQAVASFTVLFAGIPVLLERFKSFISDYNGRLIDERADSYEGVVVQSIFAAFSDGEEVTTADVAEHCKADHGAEYNTRTIGKLLKSFGLESNLVRVGGRVKRVIKKDTRILSTLAGRYLPVGHPGRESVTCVTFVTSQQGHLNKMLQTPPDGDSIRCPVTDVTDVTHVTTPFFTPDACLELMDKLGAKKEAVPTAEIISHAVPASKKDVRAALEHLKENGRIFEPCPNHWRMV